MASPITGEQIDEFVKAWFHALEDHKPAQECYDMLADDGLAMYLPDGVIWNLATFKEWYDGVTNRFFDEHHEVKNVDAKVSGNQAEVDAVVCWQARWWGPGTTKSKCVNLVTTQKWRLRPSSKNACGLEIVYYNTEARRFKLGSDPLPPTEIKMGEPQESSLRSTYQELCSSYRAIDDFRAKLLAFLPFATGGGIFLLLNTSFNAGALQEYGGAVGAFGFGITLGLFAYEIYGIKKCGALIAAGKQLEGQLGINGQFISRPRGVLRYINEPFAAGIIYPAVLAAWGFLIALGLNLQLIAAPIAIDIFLAGFIGTFFYNWWLAESGKKEKKRSNEMSKAAVIRLNERILQAEEEGDDVVLASFLADDFAIVRASGEQQTREEFLDDVPANAHHGRKADRTQVRLYGNDAVFTCRVTTKRDSDGKPATAHFWNTRVFRRQEGMWRCVAWQVTEMTQD